MSRPVPPAALFLPLHPPYAAAILAGSKRVEFRRRPPRVLPPVAVLYATAPIQHLVGYCALEGLVTDTPAALWAQFQSVAGVDRTTFAAYFGDRPVGSALLVGTVYRLTPARPVAQWEPGWVIPQNFRYVSSAAWTRLRAFPAAPTSRAPAPW